MLTPLAIAWLTVTVILAALSIYRSILVMREDDQLFISQAETALAAEYADRLRKIQHVEVFLKSFTAASGVLFVVMAAAWVYRGLNG
jgi:hypothetical protein